MVGDDRITDNPPLPVSESKEIASPVDLEADNVSNISNNPSLLDRRYLIRRPRALQYFENGVLKKASDRERVSGKFELFFDLLYVALVCAFQLLHDFKQGLVRAIPTFMPL